MEHAALYTSCIHGIFTLSFPLARALSQELSATLVFYFFLAQSLLFSLSFPFWLLLSVALETSCLNIKLLKGNPVSLPTQLQDSSHCICLLKPPQSGHPSTSNLLKIPLHWIQPHILTSCPCREPQTLGPSPSPPLSSQGLQNSRVPASTQCSAQLFLPLPWYLYIVLPTLQGWGQSLSKSAQVWVRNTFLFLTFICYLPCCLLA